jgi:gamma-glutamyltranspeptidase/glutathione hydrolase
LARAYKLLAKDGPNAFYRVPIGRAIVRRMNQGGADWKMSDLSSFQVAMGQPDHDQLQRLRRNEMPPQTQGFATLEMLNILQECASPVGYDLGALGPRSAKFWSILVQAKRLAYTDLLRYNGDPRFVHIPLKG